MSCEMRDSLVIWRVFFSQNCPILAGEELGIDMYPTDPFHILPVPQRCRGCCRDLKKQANETFRNHRPPAPISQVLPPLSSISVLPPLSRKESDS